MNEEATDFDPHTTLSADPTLGPVVETHGPLTLEPSPDLYERLVRSLIRQQVSIDAADAIEARLVERFDLTPEAMTAADSEALRDVGLSNAKVEYVKRTAEAFLDNGYDAEHFAGQSNDAVTDELTAIRGIGPWTAKMFLMFGLGREDVFPVEDLGIRHGMTALYEDDMTRAEMVAQAEQWRPYRSYASLYIWNHYENGDTEVGEP